MIVPSMTYNEITSELDKDKSQLNQFIFRALSDNKYYRAALKYKDSHFFLPIFWESRRKNKYFIIPFSFSKTKMKKNQFAFVTCAYYFDNRNNLNAVMIRDKHYSFLSSHLLDRYAERYLKDNSLDKKQLMITFAKNNVLFSGMPFISSKIGNSFFTSVQDGVLIGEDHGTFKVFKTFITKDMLKGTEIEYDNSNRTMAEIFSKAS